MNRKEEINKFSKHKPVGEAQLDRWACVNPGDVIMLTGLIMLLVGMMIMTGIKFCQYDSQRAKVAELEHRLEMLRMPLVLAGPRMEAVDHEN